VDKRDLVRMEWEASKPMEKIMIIEIQVSIIYNNAWLEGFLQVPTKGTLINDNGDFYPNTFWNTLLIASSALFSPHFNPSYLCLQNPPLWALCQRSIVDIIQNTVSNDNFKGLTVLPFCKEVYWSIFIMSKFL
jgi:hypothetical protein